MHWQWLLWKQVITVLLIPSCNQSTDSKRLTEKLGFKSQKSLLCGGKDELA